MVREEEGFAWKERGWRTEEVFPELIDWANWLCARKVEEERGLDFRSKGVGVARRVAVEDEVPNDLSIVRACYFVL